MIVIAQDQKHAGERRERGFDLTDFCSKLWSPRLVITTGYRLRPVPSDVLIPTTEDVFGRGFSGYEFEAVATGQTGSREPRWADAVVDGSITWTQRALSAQSLFRTIASTASIQWITEDGGITVTGTTLIADSVVQVSAFHSGGVEGEVHRVIARITFTDGSIEDFAIDWTIVDDEIE